MPSSIDSGVFRPGGASPVNIRLVAAGAFGGATGAGNGAAPVLAGALTSADEALDEATGTAAFSPLGGHLVRCRFPTTEVAGAAGIGGGVAFGSICCN
jgi:hypothetical protein